MHSNISLQNLTEIFKKYPDPKRPDNFILNILRQTLENNDFTFGSEIYLQILGMEMGKAYAPGLADIYEADDVLSQEVTGKRK